MLDIATRLIAAYFADAEHGINEMAQGLPRRRYASVEEDPAPPLVTLCNDADDEGVAANLDPATVPAFMVWGDSAADIDLKGSKYKIAKEVILAGAYVTDDSVDTIAASRDCGYILRAGVISLSRFNSQTNSAAYRELNGVKIMEVSSVTEQRITAAVGRRKMWGWLEIHAVVVDTLQ